MPRPQTVDRDAARKEFLRIVKERLDARIERGEDWTTTNDLASGYEDLHRQGFGNAPISSSVMQVLKRAEYRGRLFYARDVVTHKAERSMPGRGAPYRIYLRPDAPVSDGYVLVPIDARADAIAEHIALRRGVADPTLHVYHAPQAHQPEADMRDVARRLAEIVRSQSEVIREMLPVIEMLAEHRDEA